MLGPYRAVLSTPGAPAFETAGFLARLPISTIGLGIVLLVATRTDSYGLAGSVSAAALVAQAAAAPMMARLIDRVGQARVLAPAFGGFAAAVALMVATIEADLPTPVPHLAAVAVGALEPPIGACVRARWRHALAGSPKLHTAFALEAVIDEAIFMVGPVVLTILATQVHELAGLAFVTVVATLGGWWLAAQRATQPPPSRGGDDGDGGGAAALESMRWPALFPIVLVGGLLGSLFGATEVVTVAFAQDHGHQALTGALLATWASGSLIAGLVTGVVSWRAPVFSRYRVGSLAMTAVMVPLPFIDGLWVLAGTLFLAGFAISPTLVATVSLIEETVPPLRLTEGITWVTTGLGLGVALGAAVAGRLVDAYGASPAYWVAAASGALAAVVAWSTRRPPNPSH